MIFLWCEFHKYYSYDHCLLFERRVTLVVKLLRFPTVVQVSHKRHRTPNWKTGDCNDWALWVEGCLLPWPSGHALSQVKYRYFIDYSNWSKYLLLVANPLICQNGIGEPPKCTILSLIFQNSLGMAPQTFHPCTSKWYWRAPKIHHFKVHISKFPGGCILSRISLKWNCHQ